MEMERKCLYWCMKHGRRENTWLILSSLDDMLRHEETKVYGHDGNKIGREELTLSQESLKYVYCSAMGQERVTALMCDQAYYYVMDNRRSIEQEDEDKEPVEHISSRVWRNKSSRALLAAIPSAVRKHLGLKLPAKQTFKSQKQLAELDGVLPLDFARATQEEQVQLWKGLLASRSKEEALDLTGLYFLNPRVIIEAGVRPDFTTVILNQNMNFSEINWLFYFPKVHTVTIWNLDITDDKINNIAKFAPKLVTLEFHNCSNISGGVIPHVMKLPMLENLIVDNTSAIFHPEGSLHHTSLTDEQWEQVEDNYSIKQVLINSANLTRDYIKPFLGKLKGLQHFVMHDIVMRQLEKNSASGYGERKIVFHSQDNLQSGFSRMAEVKVYDLVRDKCGPMFSNSMLQKIKELDPTKADVVDVLGS